METDIEYRNVRIVVGPPDTVGAGNSLAYFVEAVKATLRAHDVSIEDFVERLGR